LKTLIIGGSGKIGKYLLEKKNKDYIYTYNKKKIRHGIHFNIAKDNLNKLLDKFPINKIILLSAISNPDDCYNNKAYSNLINVIKNKKIIDSVIKKNIYFIFFSSEFIFCGKKENYSETDKANPNNLYGKQKYQVEQYIKRKTKNFSILRISKTYGDKLNDDTLISNFILKLKKGERNFKVAIDQVFNPLYIYDLKRIVDLFLKNEIKGTYNIGGPQKLSRYACIKKIINTFNLKNKKKIYLQKTKLSNFKLLEKRPLNVSINISKIKKIINFKLTKIENVAKKIITKSKLNEKIFG